MTFKRPNSAGWAVLAIAGLCAVGFADAAFAQTRRQQICSRRSRGSRRLSRTRATSPGCWCPARWC